MANRRSVRRLYRLPLGLEPLERRDVPATFHVTNTLGDVGSTADLGNLSLAGAITLADLQPGSTIIVDEGPSLATIDLSAPLPAITAPTTITGTTNGAAPIVNVSGSSLPAIPGGNTGFNVQSSGVTIEDLAITGFSGAGVALEDPGGDVISGNYIGLGLDGSTAEGNGGPGVLIDGAPNDQVSGNFIAANGGAGVAVQGSGATGDVIQGNFVGLDATGKHAVGNATGISETGAPGLLIQGNRISGNRGDGVDLTSGSRTVVAGNVIGTDLTGTMALPNGGSGVVATSEGSDTIGGSALNALNLISANVGSGIVFNGVTNSLVAHDVIGTAVTGTAPLGNGSDGIFIEGASAGNAIGGTAPGLVVLVSGNALNGVHLFGATTTTTVAGDLIGTDVTGGVALPNGRNGVYIDGASRTTVGGTTSAARNVLSGNAGAGVWVGGTGASNNLIEGNFLGTNAAGNSTLADLFGVVVVGASGTVIGGSGAPATSSRATTSASTSSAPPPGRPPSPATSSASAPTARRPSPTSLASRSTSSPASRSRATSSPATASSASRSPAGGRRGRRRGEPDRDRRLGRLRPAQRRRRPPDRQQLRHPRRRALPDVA